MWLRLTEVFLDLNFQTHKITIAIHGTNLLKRILNRKNRLPVEQHQAAPLAVEILVAVQPAHFRYTTMRSSKASRSQDLITIP